MNTLEEKSYNYENTIPVKQKSHSKNMIIAYVVGLTLIPGIAMFIYGIIFGIMHKQEINGNIDTMTTLLKPQEGTMTAVSNIFGYAFIFLFACIYYFKTLKNEFASNSSLLSYIIKSVISSLILITVNIILSNIIFSITSSEPSNEQSIEEAFSENVPIVLRNLTFFVISVIGPVIEEIIYRYIIQNAIGKKLSKKIPKISGIISIVISSFLFGFVHTFSLDLYLINYVGLGLVLGISYYKTKNLSISITAHIINNLFSLIL